MFRTAMYKATVNERQMYYIPHTTREDTEKTRASLLKHQREPFPANGQVDSVWLMRTHFFMKTTLTKNHT